MMVDVYVVFAFVVYSIGLLIIGVRTGMYLMEWENDWKTIKTPYEIKYVYIEYGTKRT